MTQQNNDPNEFDFDDEEDASSSADAGDDDAANLFGGGGGEDVGDDEGDPWMLPPEPVGILRGFTTADLWERDGKKKLIVSVQITDPEFKGAEPLKMWFDTAAIKDMRDLMRFASALGVSVTQSGRRINWPGGSPMKALHERPGLFLVSSWDKNDGSSEPQVPKWYPAPGKSRAWDTHMEELAAAGTPYTDEQLQILKKCPGVLPNDFL